MTQSDARQHADAALLRESNEIMWSIIQRAREAIWCIRYNEPVDVTLNDDAIVDQIFGNPSMWAMCNQSMARAYDLASEAELNGRDVRFHWPRNAVNEAFIREVIANRFSVDGAISEDYRRDGTPVLMENDVRAHIADGKLYRLWGTLRQLRPADLRATDERMEHAALGFDILPIPACVLRTDGSLLIDNLAWRRSFGTMGGVAAKIVFRSAGSAGLREVVLPLPLASGESRQHLIISHWQTVAQHAETEASAAPFLAVTARFIAPEVRGGLS